MLTISLPNYPENLFIPPKKKKRKRKRENESKGPYLTKIRFFKEKKKIQQLAPNMKIP